MTTRAKCFPTIRCNDIEGSCNEQYYNEYAERMPDTIVTSPAATAESKSAPPSPKPTQPTAPVTAKPKPKQVKKAANDPGVWRTGRRDFLHAFGWLAFAGFLVTATVGALRMMFPRILFENPPSFKAGQPGDYVPMTVNEKYKDTQRVWIVRDTERIVAISAICTHLGCTPRWLSDENKFKCPCHGSGYRGLPTSITGINFEVPLRAHDRRQISVDKDGNIVVDKSVRFLYEKGEWEKPGASIKV